MTITVIHAEAVGAPGFPPVYGGPGGFCREARHLLFSTGAGAPPLVFKGGGFSSRLLCALCVHGSVGPRLEVGPGLTPDLPGREHTFLSGALLGMSRSEITRKFDEFVAFAELEKFIATPVKHSSSGMYVRLAFAVAAHLEPEILLVDEVLAVGDINFQKKCLGKMCDVARSCRTVSLVSHQINQNRR